MHYINTFHVSYGYGKLALLTVHTVCTVLYVQYILYPHDILYIMYCIVLYTNSNGCTVCTALIVHNNNKTVRVVWLLLHVYLTNNKSESNHVLKLSYTLHYQLRYLL